MSYFSIFYRIREFREFIECFRRFIALYTLKKTHATSQIPIDKSMVFNKQTEHKG